MRCRFGRRGFRFAVTLFGGGRGKARFFRVRRELRTRNSGRSEFARHRVCQRTLFGLGNSAVLLFRKLRFARGAGKGEFGNGGAGFSLRSV